MFGLSAMRIILTTSGRFPPCNPAGDASHAQLWTGRDGKRTGDGEKKNGSSHMYIHKETMRVIKMVKEESKRQRRDD